MIVTITAQTLHTLPHAQACFLTLHCVTSSFHAMCPVPALLVQQQARVQVQAWKTSRSTHNGNGNMRGAAPHSSGSVQLTSPDRLARTVTMLSSSLSIPRRRFRNISCSHHSRASELSSCLAGATRSTKACTGAKRDKHEIL